MWFPHPDVLPTDLGQELVLMEPVRSVMFSLNAAGRLLWNALPAEEAALVALLQQTYDLDLETAQRDVRDLLSGLAQRGLARQE
ncbi:MAG: PqqD family protein [Deinococcus sp.]|uniref:PqqD family protein n=2 Tax=Deinococcus TaxID=1298 RepID=UPI00242B4DDC|nr:PqqD family protein [Deinococcus wulumuqiensis]MDO4264634.1 PqqD family protein [Deinococcus sp.]